MFLTFPRELAFPYRRLMRTEDEFLKMVNKLNGHNNIYTSLYSFEKVHENNGHSKPDYDSAIIDKLFFDFDDEDCYDCTLKLHTYLEERGIKHCVNFSGRGYHLYIFVKPERINNKKSALANAQLYFLNKLKIGMDNHVIGDVSRITRLPNSLNVRRKRYCIPLKKDELHTDHQTIREIAKKQHFIDGNFIGTKKIRLSKFDTPERIDDCSDLHVDIGVCKNLKPQFPPCMNIILNHGGGGWRERWLVLMWMRETGYSEEEAKAILKEYLPRSKYVHCIKEEGSKVLHNGQVSEVYKNNRYFFPKCETLMKERLGKNGSSYVCCPAAKDGKVCEYYNKLYL